MENNLDKQKNISPEEAWEEFLSWKESMGGLSRLLEKAVKHIFTKGYNKKIYPLDYSHQALRLLKTRDLLSTRAELDLFDKENYFVTGYKLSKDYLITFTPSGSLEHIKDKIIRREFNESELGSVLDKFIQKLIDSDNNTK